MNIAETLLRGPLSSRQLEQGVLLWAGWLKSANGVKKFLFGRGKLEAGKICRSAVHCAVRVQEVVRDKVHGVGADVQAQEATAVAGGMVHPSKPVMIGAESKCPRLIRDWC